MYTLLFVHSTGDYKHCLGTNRIRGTWYSQLIHWGRELAGKQAVVLIPRVGYSVAEACRCLWLAQSRMCFKEEGPRQFPFLELPDVWEEEAESLSKHIPRDPVPPLL